MWSDQLAHFSEFAEMWFELFFQFLNFNGLFSVLQKEDLFEFLVGHFERLISPSHLCISQKR